MDLADFDFFGIFYLYHSPTIRLSGPDFVLTTMVSFLDVQDGSFLIHPPNFQAYHQRQLML